MRDLTNLLKYRKENSMKRNFIFGLILGSLFAGILIYEGYYTYALNNSGGQNLLAPTIKDCDSVGR